MKIEQIYTGCLAQGAYYIESDGEAVVIDPLREVQPYIEKTGAEIVYGPTDMKLGFAAHIAKDGEEFQVGKAKIKLIHTPGHTMESSCYLLFNEEGNPEAIFTGDTLFIGDVGRPDLAQKVVKDLTQEMLAGYLYDSLRNKIMPLPDDLIVYPAHGAGSACGKNMSKETSDSLGNQKKTNYALQEMSKKEFTKQLITGLTPPPAYFPQNVMMNIEGYDSIDDVLERGVKPLSPKAFEAAANETGALILDTRAPQVFAKGFVPNSINIGIDGSFAVWVGAMIPDLKQQILVVAEEGREEEVVTRLARVGYDYAIGYLKGGFEAWEKSGEEIDQIKSIGADELSDIQKSNPDISILDVRKESEFQSEHVQDAENAPLDYINESMAKIDKDKTYYVHCAGGYRSMVFNSILRARGYDNLIDVKGGFKDLKESGDFKITEFVCPTTLL